MKKVRVLFFLVAVTPVGAWPVLSQVAPAPAPSWGYGWGSGRIFNPATVTTIEGQVSGVDLVPAASGFGYAGIHLTLQTSEGAVPVHVGPDWYLRGQPVTFAAGDQLAVTGSRVALGGQSVLVASEVRRGDQVLRLRNEYGVPAWSGRGPGGRGPGRGLGRGGRLGSWDGPRLGPEANRPTTWPPARNSSPGRPAAPRAADGHSATRPIAESHLAAREQSSARHQS